jgi:hypothetical protein
MALIYQCLILLSNLIHWRLNQVPLPTQKGKGKAVPLQALENSEYDSNTHGTPEPFTQTEFNYLVRDLSFPKHAAKLVGSRLKAKKKPANSRNTFKIL